MFRRAFLAAALVTIHVGNAAAYDFGLLVDPDLTAYLHNAIAADIAFDGYQIAVMDGEGLDPAGWDSISDRLPARSAELIGVLGAGALTFGELNPTAAQVAEGNLTGVGVLKAGEKFSLGKPFGEGGYWVQFFLKIAGLPTTTITQPPIYIPRVPEPSGWLLAALGGAGACALRRRPFLGRGRAGR